MASFQVTYHGKDGNKTTEVGGFRFADGEMVDVTDNDTNRAALEEMRKDKAFTIKEAPTPPEPESPAQKGKPRDVEPLDPAAKGKPYAAQEKPDPKKNQDHHT
jgi:hypothetical protein